MHMQGVYFSQSNHFPDIDMSTQLQMAKVGNIKRNMKSTVITFVLFLILLFLIIINNNIFIFKMAWLWINYILFWRHHGETYWGHYLDSSPQHQCRLSLDLSHKRAGESTETKCSQQPHTTNSLPSSARLGMYSMKLKSILSNIVFQNYVLNYDTAPNVLAAVL